MAPNWKYFSRKISPEDIRKLNFDTMPGFNVSWYYSVEDFLDRKHLRGRKNYSLEEFNYFYHKDKYKCYIGKRDRDHLRDEKLELYRRYFTYHSFKMLNT